MAKVKFTLSIESPSIAIGRRTLRRSVRWDLNMPASAETVEVAASLSVEFALVLQSVRGAVAAWSSGDWGVLRGR